MTIPAGDWADHLLEVEAGRGILEVNVTLTVMDGEPLWVADDARQADFARRWLTRYVATHPDGERIVEGQL